MTADRSPADALDDLVACTATLRDRCPWDRTRTHANLRRHLLEEAHEALEALDAVAATDESDDDDARAAAFDDLCEELGDVLFQVVFHARIAAEHGRFDLADVIDGVREKLEGRHPDIFDPDGSGPVAADRTDWERAKMIEKGRTSVMDGIPRSLPALAYAAEVIAKAHTVAPEIVVDVLDDPDDPWRARLLGAVADARRGGVDAESVLRSAAGDLERRVRAREAAPEAPGAS